MTSNLKLDTTFEPIWPELGLCVGDSSARADVRNISIRILNDDRTNFIIKYASLAFCRIGRVYNERPSSHSA